jgi:general secretion pathway protein G
VLVVLVILGLLAAVVAGPDLQVSRSAKSEAAKVQVSNQPALDLYRLEVAAIRRGESVALVRSAGPSKWNGPYLKKKDAIVDPWSRSSTKSLASTVTTTSTPRLDNAQGSNGGDQDITNW